MVRGWVGYAIVRVASWIFSVLPERAARALGGAVGSLAHAPLGIRRDVVEEQLRLAFPDRSPSWRDRTARASYRHLGREAAVLARVSSDAGAGLSGRITVEGLEALRTALEEGRGAVVATGHLGNWEVGALALTGLGVPVTAVAKPIADSRVDAWLSDVRRGLGLSILPSSEAPRRVPALLRAGGIVAFVADQDAHRAGVFVPFLGRPASTPRGPALLALRAGAPLFLGVATAEPGDPVRYRVRLERVRAPRRGSPREDAARLTEALTRALSGAVRAHPEQYFWHHRRWKTRPTPALRQEQASEGPV